jgi:hypothetical protein
LIEKGRKAREPLGAACENKIRSLLNNAGAIELRAIYDSLAGRSDLNEENSSLTITDDGELNAQGAIFARVA